MNIDWLMGFIEAKGCFSIPKQKIKVDKKNYDQYNIITLSKEDLVREVKRLFKQSIVLSKKSPKSPLEVLIDLMTIHLSSPKELSKRPVEELRELLIAMSAVKSINTDDYSYFSRPTFSLTFPEKERYIISQIKKLMNNQGIRIYGPYEINKGTNLRLEVKGFENCMKLYDLLAKQIWFTSKKDDFEKWGNDMLIFSKK